MNFLIQLNKKIKSKVKLEKSPNIELHQLKAMDQSFVFLQTRMQKCWQEGVQRTPEKSAFFSSLYNSSRTVSENFSVRSKDHHLEVNRQSKLGPYSVDGEILCLIKVNSLPWDPDMHDADYPCGLSMK